MASAGTMLFVLLWAPAAARELSIINFGAEPVEPVSRGPRASKFGEGEANATRAVLNGKALYDAMRSARKGDVVVVPAEQRFVMVPYAPLYRLEHVVLRLEGCLAAFEPQPGEHAKVWPFYLGNFESLITIHLSSHVTISGGGALDGRGHNWWVAFARNKLASKRPMLLQIDGSTDVVVCAKIKILRRVLNRRVDLHAIDAALLLDGVAMPVHHRWTEPARPRHRRDMT